MKVEKGKTYKAKFDNSICDKNEIVIVESFQYGFMGMDLTCKVANTNIVKDKIPASGFVNIFEKVG